MSASLRSSTYPLASLTGQVALYLAVARSHVIALTIVDALARRKSMLSARPLGEQEEGEGGGRPIDLANAVTCRPRTFWRFSALAGSCAFHPRHPQTSTTFSPLGSGGGHWRLFVHPCWSTGWAARWCLCRLHAAERSRATSANNQCASAGHAGGHRKSDPTTAGTSGPSQDNQDAI